MTLYSLSIGSAQQTAPFEADASYASRRYGAVEEAEREVPAYVPASRNRGRFPRLFPGLVVVSAVVAALSFQLRPPNPASGTGEGGTFQPVRARWVDIARPYALYTLDVPEFAKVARLYAARRQDIGKGRLDLMTLGTFGDGAPWMHLGIRRFGSEADVSFFVDIARRAADAGVSISRSGAPEQIGTRFGALEYAPVLLERGDAASQCLAYRFAEPGPDLNMTGLYCGQNGQPPEPGVTVCLLDRLSLAAAGDDVALRQIFAAAELKRGRFCAGAKYLVADAGKPPPAIVPVVEPTAPSAAPPRNRKRR